VSENDAFRMLAGSTMWRFLLGMQLTTADGKGSNRGYAVRPSGTSLALSAFRKIP
jgi:hypothetical protein